MNWSWGSYSICVSVTESAASNCSCLNSRYDCYELQQFSFNESFIQSNCSSNLISNFVLKLNATLVPIALNQTIDCEDPTITPAWFQNTSAWILNSSDFQPLTPTSSPSAEPAAYQDSRLEIAFYVIIVLFICIFCFVSCFTALSNHYYAKSLDFRKAFDGVVRNNSDPSINRNFVLIFLAYVYAMLGWCGRSTRSSTTRK